ncbi:LOW QUALITY PROTEIN: protein SSUH2 homolog [Guaruba guarouba]
MPLMTEAVARQVLLRFVSLQCCYGSRAAWELAIQRLRQAGTYRYQLETFSELRLSEWVFQPFTKPRAAGPPGDAHMVLWDMEVGPPLLFQGWTQWCVPCSALVRDCHRCHGHGRSKCRVCHGTSWTRCVTCKGSQRRLKQQKRCQLCSSTGHKRCNTCSGQHSKTCATCQGEKKLHHFKHLAITWKNNVFEFVSEHHLNFPGELLSKVSGESIFKDEKVTMSATPSVSAIGCRFRSETAWDVSSFPLPDCLHGTAINKQTRSSSPKTLVTYQNWEIGRIQAQTRSPPESYYSMSCICSEDFASGVAESLWVYPIIDFPEPEISLASQRAIAEHSAVLPASSCILWLHQSIELIPITEVHYQYSGKPYLYYIYGLENKVYALDYPERCCCSCTII